MKEVILSQCEKEFILTCINNKQRIDARPAFEYRHIQISFGSDYGCCQVQLGNTRVFAQVYAELGVPRPTRPKDGVLHVNVELSPMASPNFEAWRLSDEAVELNRLLERCIKESLSIDTESLCVIAGEKVWVIRAIVTVLNHDGNILDCTCIAAVTALSHFRINEVTVDHKIVTIMEAEERKLIPLNVIHLPLCVTFAFFMQGKLMVVDPCEREERVMEGRVVVGMNKHREVCTLQATGTMLPLQAQVLRCVNMAAVKVKAMTETIQRALADDTASRAKGGVNFSQKAHTVTTRLAAPADRDSDHTRVDVPGTEVTPTHNEDSEMKDEQVVISDEEMAEMEQSTAAQSEATRLPGGKPVTAVHTGGASSGSEEEPVILQTLDATPQPVVKKQRKRNRTKTRKKKKEKQ